MSRSRVAASHVEWLSLVETTGVFLTVPVVKRVFPNGVDPIAPDLRSEVRLRLSAPPHTQAEATGWIRWVLNDLLGLRAMLLDGPAVPDRATHLVTEQGVLLRPEFAVADAPKAGTERVLRMLVLVFPFGTARDRPLTTDRWAANPIERAHALQRATGVPLAMATDGDWFSVVASPAGGTATSATWISTLFGEEPILLDSFGALLGARRFFAVDAPNTLPAMLAESAQAQEEVTSRLGTQVRQAVELLVGALSRANRARRGELLSDVTADDVYAGALTVMMRLVFLLYAEERDLLPAREALYAGSYGALGLREQLQEEADRFGEEALERRSAGWHRLLATFRAIHGGIEHEALRLPAYGGGLFDPDRYPFLEGRREGEPWRSHEAHPLPVDDRSILAILDALQILSFRDAGITEARRLSYRSLDVEQIGHVYEGLLDHGATWVDDLAVGLKGSTSDGPERALVEIEETAAKGRAALLKYLVEQTGRTQAQIEKGLAFAPPPDVIGRLRSACEHDGTFSERVLPYLGLLEEDLRGLPMVFLPGSVYVTQTTERRDTGTQYTPKDLADEIVRYALEPLVYDPGPAQGAEPADWRIKPPEAILDLRVCDPAVGSGAILVAACRYLSERLIEAARSHLRTDASAQLLDPDDPDVALVARRLIVDHCLYGVDRNPLAAEMAKLSLWLVTLAKERPFTFLDHAVRVGDSLIGITSLDQVRYLHLDPERGRRLHSNLLAVTDAIQPLVDEALEWIRAMRAVEPISVSDVEEQRAMNAEADRALANVRTIADAIVGKALAATRAGSVSFDERLAELSVHIRKALDARRSEAERLAIWTTIRDEAAYDLDTGRPAMAPPRRPLHWPLAFPEVMAASGRFDAMIGNPPFLGGTRISGANGGDYRDFIAEWIANGRKTNRSDLCAFFLLRAHRLAHGFGFLATNTVSQGDTRQTGLDYLVKRGWTITRATKSAPWPGAAAVEIAKVWMQDSWHGPATLDGHAVASISPMLEAPSRVSGQPDRLEGLADYCRQGWKLDGLGFLMTPEQAQALIARDPRNGDVLGPYLNGDDVTKDPKHRPSRWAINFRDWSLEEAARYPDCLAIVEELVRPERERNNRAHHRKYWWQFAETRPGLVKVLAGLERVLVVAQTSKFVTPAFVPAQQILSTMLIVFAYDDDFHFGVLSSAMHFWWVEKYASTLETRIRYTPTDVFETFPQPGITADVAGAGRALDHYRRDLMIESDEGLTKTYNRLHNASDTSPGVTELRRLHVALDEAVAAAYGWGDLALDHGFQETRIGTRYTVGPEAQTEVLDRLLELNHARYAREQAPQTTGARQVRRRTRSTPGQMSLVGED